MGSTPTSGTKRKTESDIPPRWRWGPQKCYIFGVSVADATDSKSVEGNFMWVRGAPKNMTIFLGKAPTSGTNKKIELRQRFLFESLKSARFFCSKRQTKMLRHFALALMRRKLFQERVKIIIITLSRPNTFISAFDCINQKNEPCETSWFVFCHIYNLINNNIHYIASLKLS